jgi:hypothetical protein
MRTSRDVIFDESRPFYPRPSSAVSPASLVDHLIFLFFSDAPPTPLPIPRSTLPSSMSSSEYSLVDLYYMIKSLVTQFYSHRGALLSDAPPSLDELSYNVSSSSFLEDAPSCPSVVPSSLEQLIRSSHYLYQPPDYYSPSAFIVTTLSEPASYRDAILHPEWQYAMIEEIAALE